MNEFSSAGIEFSIGSTKIPGCISTPDFGGEPDKIDVSSFDNKTTKSYIPGLMDVQTLNFDFYDNTTNFNTAKSSENAASNTYSTKFPDGCTVSVTGTHKVYKLAANVGEAIKFRIAVTPNSEISVTNGTVTE